MESTSFNVLIWFPCWLTKVLMKSTSTKTCCVKKSGQHLYYFAEGLDKKIMNEGRKHKFGLYMTIRSHCHWSCMIDHLRPCDFLSFLFLHSYCLSVSSFYIWLQKLDAIHCNAFYGYLLSSSSNALNSCRWGSPRICANMVKHVSAPTSSHIYPLWRRHSVIIRNITNAIQNSLKDREWKWRRKICLMYAL